MILRLKCLSFIFILLRYEAKCMKLKIEATKAKAEVLGEKILDLVGERREEALQAYRKIMSASAEEPMYLTRS
jgi:hypothetical protein